MAHQTSSLDICNVCFRCREYISLSEDPLLKQKIWIFSKLHQNHPHGFDPPIDISRFRCVDDKIIAMIKK